MDRTAVQSHGGGWGGVLVDEGPRALFPVGLAPAQCPGAPSAPPPPPPIRRGRGPRSQVLCKGP